MCQDLLTHSRRQPHVPVSALTSHAGEVCPSDPSAPQVQETRGNRLCRCTCEVSSPPHPPRLFKPFLQKERLLSSLGLGQLGDTVCNSGDHRPPTSMAKTTRRARLPLRSLRLLALEHHSGVTQLCDALQCFATSGPDPCPVPRLGLSTVDLMPAFEHKCCSNAVKNGADAMWVWSDDEDVVKEGANHFILSEL